jgi:ubiquinone/menaquinone biosynthesis C-methylase UbiE
MSWGTYWKSGSFLRLLIETSRSLYFARVFASVVKKCSRGKVLEAGCGTGKSLKFLKNQVGLDNSAEAIKIAKRHCRNLVVADIRKLPFKENSFDMTFNQGVMEHFSKSDFDQILKEFRRVGKKVLIIVPSKTSVFTVLNPFREFKKFFSKEELKTLIERRFKSVKADYMPATLFISVMGYGEK